MQRGLPNDVNLKAGLSTAVTVHLDKKCPTVGRSAATARGARPLQRIGLLPLRTGSPGPRWSRRHGSARIETISSQRANDLGNQFEIVRFHSVRPTGTRLSRVGPRLDEVS
jgi:hypothetical protein